MKDYKRDLEQETLFAVGSISIAIILVAGAACTQNQPTYHFFTTSLGIYAFLLCGWIVSALWNLMVTRRIETASSDLRYMINHRMEDRASRHVMDLLRDEVITLTKECKRLNQQVAFLQEREIENTFKQDAINKHYGISVEKVESEYRVEELY